jgi:D-glycero-D-manno-heptose 1,7-bisphosphate phosphatase
VFFDRDDTLIENGSLSADAFAGKPGDLVDLARIRPLPGAVEACQRAAALGLEVFIVTNQGVVARGGATIGQVEAACLRTVEVLGSPIRAVFACPFHPEGRGPAEFCREHDWRKPAAGMVRAAAELFNLDLARSWMIGDAQRDVDAGLAAGLPAEQCLRVGSEFPLGEAMDRVERTLAASHG